MHTGFPDSLRRSCLVRLRLRQRRRPIFRWLTLPNNRRMHCRPEIPGRRFSPFEVPGTDAGNRLFVTARGSGKCWREHVWPVPIMPMRRLSMVCLLEHYSVGRLLGVLPACSISPLFSMRFWPGSRLPWRLQSSRRILFDASKESFKKAAFISELFSKKKFRSSGRVTVRS